MILLEDEYLGFADAILVFNGSRGRARAQCRWCETLPKSACGSNDVIPTKTDIVRDLPLSDSTCVSLVSTLYVMPRGNVHFHRIYVIVATAHCDAFYLS
jgi:hypothetical protein